MSTPLKTASVARAILYVVCVCLLVMETVAVAYRATIDWNGIKARAEQRAVAALNLVEVVHEQAMLNSHSGGDADPAIATLDGTLSRLSNAAGDVDLWLTMSPKLIARSHTNAAQQTKTPDPELPRDRVDQDAIVRGETATGLVDGKLRVSRPSILGVGTAGHPKCAACHASLKSGDVIGTYSAAVDLAKPRALWRSQTFFETISALGITLIVMGVIAILLNFTTLAPLRRLTAATRRLATGNLAVEIEGTSRGDELGTLARSLEVFRDNLAEKLNAEQKIAHMAGHDVLTGLPNRASLLRFLNKAVGEYPANTKIAVVSLDLDAFKEINYLHGHDEGDRILTAVAANLTASLEEGEFVARVGGDEFAAFKRYKDQSDLFNFVCRLKTVLQAETLADASASTVGAHIGVAVWPDDAETTDALLAKADNALERAKSTNAPNGICYYEASLDDEARRRRALMAGLASAARNGELSVNYQVQKSLKTLAVTGYEALLRWKHPQLGPVSPAEFIPLAEQCGAIHEIGEWVLRAACREAATWPAGYKVAVNLSGMQIARPGLPELVHDVLIETGLPAKRLELEITETAIIADKEAAREVLRQIRAIGVSIALDDFGRGYSSLETLRYLPLDKIKLDRFFVTELVGSSEARAIIRAIVTLGKTLAIPVLAEGIETEDELAVLRRENCSEGQGYLFGRPELTVHFPPRALEAS